MSALTHTLGNALERIGDLLASQLVGALVQLLIAYVGGGN